MHLTVYYVPEANVKGMSTLQEGCVTNIAATYLLTSAYYSIVIVSRS